MSVLVNGLLLNGQYSGVHHTADHLYKSIEMSETEISIDVLVSKSYTGQRQKYKYGEVVKATMDTKSPFKRVLYENLLMAKLIKEKGYQLYHSTSYVLPYYWNKNSVLTVHDTISLDFPAYCQYTSILHHGLLMKRSIKKATKIIAVSETVKEDILRNVNIDDNKVEVIHHGIDEIFRKKINLTQINTVKWKYALPDNYVLFVGNIEPKKNLDRLVDAFIRLKREKAIPHQLVIAGKKGWRCDLRNKIKELKLQDLVLFVDYIDQTDLPTVYHLADVFAFPSLYEGFGIPPLEAMACSTPTLTSNQGASCEVTGGNSLGINPYSVEDIKEGLNQLIHNEKLRTSLINDGLQWTKRFTWEKAANKTIDVYCNLL